MQIGLRHFCAETLSWFEGAVREGGASRGALAKELCARSNWRNTQGEPCVASARKILPRLASQLELRLPAAAAPPPLGDALPLHPDLHVEATLAALGTVSLEPAEGREGSAALPFDDGVAPSGGGSAASRQSVELSGHIVSVRVFGRDRLLRGELAPEGAGPVYRLERASPLRGVGADREQPPLPAPAFGAGSGPCLAYAGARRRVGLRTIGKRGMVTGQCWRIAMSDPRMPGHRTLRRAGRMPARHRAARRAGAERGRCAACG